MYYVRTFSGRDPGMLIFDVDMLKDVLVKDAANFQNRYVRCYTFLYIACLYCAVIDQAAD